MSFADHHNKTLEKYSGLSGFLTPGRGGDRQISDMGLRRVLLITTAKRQKGGRSVMGLHGFCRFEDVTGESENSKNNQKKGGADIPSLINVKQIQLDSL